MSRDASLTFLLRQSVFLGVDLAHDESRLERCCCWSTGAGYLGCQYLLAFKKADMADTKRTYCWLSWFRSRKTHQQKELTLSHEFIAVEQQKTPLDPGSQNRCVWAIPPIATTAMPISASLRAKSFAVAHHSFCDFDLALTVGVQALASDESCIHE